MYRFVVSLAAIAALAFSAAVEAQVQRSFPKNALRGEVSFRVAPEVMLNKKPARLAPDVRIRGSNNMMIVPGDVKGRSMVVNYTVDQSGMLQDIWILGTEEIKAFWPRSAAEAAQLDFNAAAQVWAKRSN
jgi:hypothetical protein